MVKYIMWYRACARRNIVAGFILSIALSGCQSGDSAEPDDDTSSPTPPAVNGAPQITGSPQGLIQVGENYSFTPQASDPDNDPISFSIQNRPEWAAFNTTSGALSGTPQAGDEGTYLEIIISVTDGSLSDSLSPASLTVRATNFVPLTSIPAIPFDYAQAPGAITRSGSIPTTLNAGEVLSFTDQTINSDATLTCSGTEASPAFILGGTLTGNNDVFRISGSWCVFIDTVFDNVQPRTSGDHHIFRNVEITRVAGKNGMDLGGSNMVIVDSEIHHNQGDDRHGMQVTRGAESVWILRNYVHHNGGDGIQACHKCSADPPRNVYIGQNLFHSDRENAIDFKYIENVIVEGNTIHSLVSAPRDEMWCFDDGSSCGVFSSGSDGSAIVVGSDGGPTNVLIIGNEIYDTNHAIRIEEGTAIRVEDNFLHDINRQCLQLDKDGFDTVFSGNTCINADRGIFQNWRVNFSLTVDDNLFENLSGPSVEYETRAVGEASSLTNNIFRNSGPVIYANTTATTESTINALPNSGNNQVE